MQTLVDRAIFANYGYLNPQICFPSMFNLKPVFFEEVAEGNSIVNLPLT